MTTESDPLTAFTAALTPAARSHLELTPRTIPTIRAACAASSPQTVARTVSSGIGWNHPANPWPRMWHRIRRAAGIDTDDTPQPQEAPD